MIQGGARSPIERMKFEAQALFNSCFVHVYPLQLPMTTNASGKLKKRSSLTRVMGGRRVGT
jgi:hypothetical protein